MGPERVRRSRGPGGGLVPEGAERGAARARAGRALDRGGVDGVAGRLAARLPRRARLRLQVEHGLDARHARVLLEGAGPPALPPSRADVLARLRLERELRPAALARRGRARQALAARAHARRPLAAVREPPRAVRLHVGASRQAAPVHGLRVRAGARVERAGRVARLARARRSRPRRRACARARPQPHLPRRARALGGRFLLGRLPLAGAERRVRERRSPSRASPPTGRGRSSASQPLARRARRLAARAARRRASGSRC